MIYPWSEKKNFSFLCKLIWFHLKQKVMKWWKCISSEMDCNKFDWFDLNSSDDVRTRFFCIFDRLIRHYRVFSSSLKPEGRIFVDWVEKGFLNRKISENFQWFSGGSPEISQAFSFAFFSISKTPIDFIGFSNFEDFLMVQNFQRIFLRFSLDWQRIIFIETANDVFVFLAVEPLTPRSLLFYLYVSPV